VEGELQLSGQSAPLPRKSETECRITGKKQAPGNAKLPP
jgi:hypothetical protein